MQTLITTGRLFYGTAILAFGLLHVGYGDFVTRVVPWWPAALPGRSIAAYAIGTLLIAAGVALLIDRRTVAVSTLLGWGLLLSFALLGVPLAARDTLLGGSWTVAAKALALSGGALLVAQAAAARAASTQAASARATSAQAGSPHEASAQGADRTSESLWLDPRVAWLWSLAPWFFAAFLVLCGIQHFLYIDFVTSLVPAWIPFARFWAYAAGVALIAGGLGLLLPATARLAGLLSGLMIFSWVFLVHIPRAAQTFPATSNETTAVFEALAMTGIAWLAAALSEHRQPATAPEAHRPHPAPDVRIPIGK